MANTHTVNDNPPPTLEELKDIVTFPVWQDLDPANKRKDVESLFKLPYWFDEPTAEKIGEKWYSGMENQYDPSGGLRLFDKQGHKPCNVWDHGPQIFKLISLIETPHMPPNKDEQFPPEACERFRNWYNQGGRLKKDDPYPPADTKRRPAEILQSNAPPIPLPPYVTPKKPVWDAGDPKPKDDKGLPVCDIKQCFTLPPWAGVGESAARSAASSWVSAMKNFEFNAQTGEAFDLSNYDHVKSWGRTVYSHIASQSMPIDPPWFPTAAVEAFRLWYNAGCPKSIADYATAELPLDPIPREAAEKPFRLRKDINELSASELTTYREKLQQIMQTSLPDSKWQVGGFLHSNWCLHYMQASFPWHRAHLLWLENEIGFPIPYWNFYSSKAADPTAPDSGIPQAFLDDTYVDSDNITQMNPLKYALARNGESQASDSKKKLPFVTRAQPFENPDGVVSRADYITNYVPYYQAQIYHALKMDNVGDPQADGMAFTFAQPNLDPVNKLEFYKKHLHEMDGLLEQAHDNVHGWTGADMSNNSYAAFDPLFWSYHANFDRLFETWIRKHDNSVSWSSNFPLRPFIGRDNQITVDEDNSHPYRYTTIGDMVRDTKSLGYTYRAPKNADYAPSGTTTTETPMVVISGVGCTAQTYKIHIAISTGKDDEPALKTQDVPPNPPCKGYVNFITRLGMGQDTANNRCITGGVIRRLDATKAAQEMNITHKGDGTDDEVPLRILILAVTYDTQGQETDRVVPYDEYKNLPGFQPFVVWVTPPGGGITAH